MYVASAVIPTTGRDELVRAVQSVLNQTVKVEPIVVLDQPERQQTVKKMLEGMPYKLITTEGRVGGAKARNIGVDNVATDIVGFLDDDDEWLPQKTKYQLSEIGANDRLVATSKSLLVGKHTRIVPVNAYSPEETMASYLITRDSIRLTNNFMQTSSILMHRSLCNEINWNPSLPRHQDWAFFIDLQNAGAEFVSRPEVLVRVHQGSTNSISRSNAWEPSVSWLETYGRNATPTSRADFLAAIVLRSALRAKQWRAVASIFNQLMRSRPHFAAMIVGLSGVLEK